MLDRRRAGVLLHPTSLPGPGPQGRFGMNARRFIDLIADAGFTIWQILPLGPVDESRSPYLLRSAHAGAPEFVDPTLPVGDSLRDEFEDWRQQQYSWLHPYTLFETIRKEQENRPWWEWPAGLRNRDPAALAAVESAAADRLTAIAKRQFLFEQQWTELRAYANERGVQILGDLPFYLYRNSVDVWAHRKLFDLDENDVPVHVAGVPPDYFSSEGQLWGNPVYAWPQHEAEGFDWWLKRIDTQARRFDGLRIDHFRALDSYWVVPRDAETARDGHWLPTPGVALLEAIERRYPELAIVAEDLGIITDPVRELRDRFHLPGMLILQFAFDGSPDNPYLPANHARRTVVYTGTHDNDTTVGWYDSLEDASRHYVHEIVGGAPMPQALIDAAYRSVADTAVIPMQDLLGLGGNCRMNVPGVAEGNWTWRFSWEDVPEDFAGRFRQLAIDNDRLPD